MSETKLKTRTNIQISTEAHAYLMKHADLLARRLGLSSVTLTDTASKLILETPLPTNGTSQKAEE